MSWLIILGIATNFFIPSCSSSIYRDGKGPSYKKIQILVKILKMSCKTLKTVNIPEISDFESVVDDVWKRQWKTGLKKWMSLIMRRRKVKVSSTNPLSTQVRRGTRLSLFLVYIVLRLYTQYQLTWDEKARDQENNLHEYLAGESYLCQMFIRISKVKWFCQACSGPETMISLKLVDMCIIATKLSWFNILDKLCFKVGTSNKFGPI